MATSPRAFVLATMFTTGDVVPFVRLGARLRARGHRVTLVTHASYQNLADTAELGFATWDSPAEHAALLADGALFDDITGFTTMYARHVVPKLRREADALRAVCDAQTVLVTRCGPAIAARAVAEQSGATLVEAYLGPGHVSPLDVVRAFVQPFRDEIATLRARTDDLDAWITAANARFGCWSSWFSPQAPHTPPLELVGFTSPEGPTPILDPAVAARLAGPRPRILLACGTGRFLTPSVIAACAQVTDALGGTLFVVTPFDELVPPALPACVHRLRSVPYASLMPHVDLVLHHGGIGTAADALRASVPQIILGAGGDRPVNARCIEQLGVGHYLPPAAWGVDAIRTAARELLGSTEVRQACARAAEHLRTDTEEACRFLERVPLDGFPSAIARSPREATRGDGSPLDPRLAALTPAQRALLARRLRR